MYVILRHRTVLWSLFWVNVIGTIYGYMWYGDQLVQTPIHFIPFVPDSPTASLFFVFVLIAFLSGKNWPLLEALAAVTLIKYGLWAVVMNTAAGIAGDTLNWTHYMLIFSHLGMAIQAVLYAPFFRIKTWHIVVTALWTVHNDIIDYLFGMQPWLSRELMPWINEIGYFTFWLSIFSIAVVYFQQQWQQKRSIEGG